MHNSINIKKSNHRRHYTYVSSGKGDTTVVHMDTRVDIVQRENKTSTLHTTINKDV